MVRLTERPEMTLDVYRGRKTTQQQLIGTTHPGAPSFLKGLILKGLPRARK